MQNDNIIDVLNDMKYRIEITKRARIKASARLRSKHLIYEKIIHLYSILILILTIWFLGNDELNTQSTKILLILSLTITFLSMYLNMQNYKERAGSFETNYQNLDILLNRIKRKLLSDEVIGIGDIKEFQREYEKLLIDKENHSDIDYKKAFEDYTRSQSRKSKDNILTDEGEEKNKAKDEIQKVYNVVIKKINNIQWFEIMKYICLAIFPVIIILILLVFEFLMKKFL
ncbi:SLATT domain-containing protein [Sporosarcina koreensis]|uniref:SLATT domain-containing protein n=1 Tax=Sporosarcina koreensis TaxID=334735 RepID=A0ABW0TUQ8_9BACL